MIPLFSIVIPTFNSEKYISTALESLLRQSFKDFEVLITDDGSTDSTYCILSEFAKKHKRFHIYQQKNQGPLIARRNSLAHATGQYVLFLDADDFLHDDALLEIASAIKQSMVDIISFPFSRKSDFSVSEGMQLQSGEYRDKEYMKVKECVCLGRFNNLWGKAVRLSCIDFDADYKSFTGLMHGEDLFQLLPIIDCAKSLVQLDKPLYYYRNNDSSSTSRFRKQQLSDIVIVNQRLVEYANKWGSTCIKAVTYGMINQYINLLKMSELENTSYSTKVRHFKAIAITMKKERVFQYLRRLPLRPDYLFLIIALKYNIHLLVTIIVLISEWLKKWK